MSPKQLAALIVLALLAHTPSAVHATAEVGKPAPEFSAMGSDGKTHALGDYKGKIVVLAWLNHGCPYVRNHYETGNMQALQKELADKGVVWLSIISSAPGQQGHSSPAKANTEAETNGAHPAAILLDEDGAVGRLYEAKTTPHIYLTPSLSPKGGEGASPLNPVAAAFSEQATQGASVPKRTVPSRPPMQRSTGNVQSSTTQECDPEVGF